MAFIRKLDSIQLGNIRCAYDLEHLCEVRSKEDKYTKKARLIKTLKETEPDERKSQKTTAYCTE